MDIAEIVRRLEWLERFLAPYMTGEKPRPIPKLLPPDMCETTVDQLEITVRLAHCLDANEYLGVPAIETVGAILAVDESELMRRPNFGKVSLRELIECLEKLAAQYNTELPPGWCRIFRNKMKRERTFAMSINDPRRFEISPEA